jgi:hypothetical protein
MAGRALGENFFQIRCDELVFFLAECFGAAQYVCKKFTHTVLLIDKQKYKGTRCNKSGIGLVKVVVEAFVTNRSQVCWCDPSLKTLSPPISLLWTMCVKECSQEVDL